MSERCAWYGTQRWRRIARNQLREHPLCRMCLEDGHVVPATVADHVEPHEGQQYAFWFGQLQSLCATHHNSTKAFQEINGYSIQVDADGWPLDPNHPCNSNAKAKARAPRGGRAAKPARGG